jgi:hypothetical protein
MGLFSFLKKEVKGPYEPYADGSTNLIYNLLFCDNLELYKNNYSQPYAYPFDVLFRGDNSSEDLQNVIDNTVESRVKVLAYNKLRENENTPKVKELLAIIVELGLDNGLDVLASFADGTARYINQTGKMLIWETKDDISDKLTNDLFLKGRTVVDKIGPWDQPRRAYPTKGNTRITFLVSDGLYFGEAATNVLFADPLASPTLLAATALMQYLTEKSVSA